MVIKGVKIKPNFAALGREYQMDWRTALYVIIDVSERKKNLWYNKNYHNITERGFICTTVRN